MKDYEHHPLSEIFPLMEAAEIKALATDIEANDLQTPIVLYEGKILDGRHRYEACQIAGVKPRFIKYEGEDPLAFVWSANFKRRHLTVSQLAMVAAKMANMQQGERTDLPSAIVPKVSQGRAADTTGVSTRSVTTAAKVLDESPRLAKQVLNGKISLNAAHQQVKEKETKAEPVYDATGLVIPAFLIPLWNRSGEVHKLMTAVSNAKTALEHAQEEDDPLYRPITAVDAEGKGETWSGLIAALTNAYRALKLAIPYAVCPACSGRIKNCTTCWGRGFVSEHFWKVQTAKETRAIRANVVTQQEAAR